MPSHYSETELVNAHSHSSHNLEEVQKSSDCGCFSCLKIFSPSEVTEWLADGTVVCPYCAVDSILGSMSGYPLTKDFLAEMNGRWFRKITRPSRQKNMRNAIARPGPLIRCPICDTPLVDRDDYMTHLRSVHPSYTAWGRKNARNAFVEVVIVTSIVLISNFLLPSNTWVLILGAVSFVAVVLITISYTIMIRRRFRRGSKDQTAEGTQLSTQ